MADGRATSNRVCEGRVNGEWRSRPCESSARYEIGGKHVCGTHHRVAKRWQQEGRLESMIEFWWKP